MSNSNGNFVIETNASDIAVGAVLMQYNKSIALISKALNSMKCNYYTTNFESLEIVIACKGWHPYLDGKRTTLLTDYKPPLGIHTTPGLKK